MDVKNDNYLKNHTPKNSFHPFENILHIFTESQNARDLEDLERSSSPIHDFYIASVLKDSGKKITSEVSPFQFFLGRF